MRRLTLPALAAGLLICGALTAEPDDAGLSLDQAQAQAAEHNPALRRLEALARGAEARPAGDLAAYLPQAGIKGQHLLDARYGSMDVVFGGSAVNFPTAFPQDTLDLYARWTLFDGLKGFQAWQADSDEARAARLELVHAAGHLRQEVAVRYYKALAARQLALVARQNVATLEDHLALAQASEDSGSSTHFDVLRVSAQHEEALAGAQQADDLAELSRLDLATAMGLSQDARSLQGALPVPQADDVADGLSPDLATRPDLQAQALRHDATLRRSTATLGAWAPTLYAFATREYFHYGDFDPSILATQGFGSLDQAGLAFSWDLYNGGADSARRAEAQAQAQAAALSLTDARLNAQRDFNAWTRRFRDSARLYQARLKVLEQCQESVRLAQLGVKAGSRTNSELLDAELDLFRARAGLVQAQSDAAEARLNVEWLKGGG